MKSLNKKIFSTSSRGFTLLEVMISLSILAIGLVAVMQLFSSSLRNAKVSQDYTKAIFAARQMMEEILVEAEDLEGFEDSGEFENLPDYFWTVRSELFEPEEMDGGERYSLKPEETLSEEPVTDTYKIDFTVTWNPSGDKRKSFTLSTLKLVHRQVEIFEN